MSFAYIGIALSLRDYEGPVIRQGMALAESVGAQVTLIHVVETLMGVPLEAEAPLAASPEVVDATGNTANAVQRYAAYQLGVDISTWTAPPVRVCEGDVAQVLAEVSQDFDCLVMGHHHTSLLRRLAGRTTDEALTECCACPILVVPYVRLRAKAP